MNDDKIASALGLRPLAEVRDEEHNLPVEVEETSVPTIISEEDDENIQDLEIARQNIQGIIATGDDALKEMLSIAKQAESARAFEVVSTLMKTMLDANKDFVDISTKKKFAKEELNGPKEAAQSNVTNNNLIISTADLLKMIKGTDG
jgi:hypothetical protein